MPQTLSVAIITKNEEANLRAHAGQRPVCRPDRGAGLRLDRPHGGDRPRRQRHGLRGAVAGICRGQELGHRQVHRHMGPLARRRRGADPGAADGDSDAAALEPARGRVLHPPPQSLSRPLDQARRLLSRPQAAPLPPRPGQLHHAAAVPGPPRARDHRLRRQDRHAGPRPHPPRLPDAGELHRAHGPLQHAGQRTAGRALARSAARGPRLSAMSCWFRS